MLSRGPLVSAAVLLAAAGTAEVAAQTEELFVWEYFGNVSARPTDVVLQKCRHIVSAYEQNFACTSGTGAACNNTSEEVWVDGGETEIQEDVVRFPRLLFGDIVNMCAVDPECQAIADPGCEGFNSLADHRTWITDAISAGASASVNAFEAARHLRATPQLVHFYRHRRPPTVTAPIADFWFPRKLRLCPASEMEALFSAVGTGQNEACGWKKKTVTLSQAQAVNSFGGKYVCVGWLDEDECKAKESSLGSRVKWTNGNNEFLSGINGLDMKVDNENDCKCVQKLTYDPMEYSWDLVGLEENYDPAVIDADWCQTRQLDHSNSTLSHGVQQFLAISPSDAASLTALKYEKSSYENINNLVKVIRSEQFEGSYGVTPSPAEDIKAKLEPSGAYSEYLCVMRVPKPTIDGAADLLTDLAVGAGLVPPSGDALPKQKSYACVTPKTNGTETDPAVFYGWCLEESIKSDYPSIFFTKGHNANFESSGRLVGGGDTQTCMCLQKLPIAVEEHAWVPYGVNFGDAGESDSTYTDDWCREQQRQNQTFVFANGGTVTSNNDLSNFKREDRTPISADVPDDKKDTLLNCLKRKDMMLYAGQSGLLGCYFPHDDRMSQTVKRSNATEKYSLTNLKDELNLCLGDDRCCYVRVVVLGDSEDYLYERRGYPKDEWEQLSFARCMVNKNVNGLDYMRHFYSYRDVSDMYTDCVEVTGFDEGPDTDVLSSEAGSLGDCYRNCAYEEGCVGFTYRLENAGEFPCKLKKTLDKTAVADVGVAPTLYYAEYASVRMTSECRAQVKAPWGVLATLHYLENYELHLNPNYECATAVGAKLEGGLNFKAQDRIDGNGYHRDVTNILDCYMWCAREAGSAGVEKCDGFTFDGAGESSAGSARRCQPKRCLHKMCDTAGGNGKVSYADGTELTAVLLVDADGDADASTSCRTSLLASAGDISTTTTTTTSPLIQFAETFLKSSCRNPLGPSRPPMPDTLGYTEQRLPAKWNFKQVACGGYVASKFPLDGQKKTVGRTLVDLSDVPIGSSLLSADKNNVTMSTRLPTMRSLFEVCAKGCSHPTGLTRGMEILKVNERDATTNVDAKKYQCACYHAAGQLNNRIAALDSIEKMDASGALAAGTNCIDPTQGERVDITPSDGTSASSAITDLATVTDGTNDVAFQVGNYQKPGKKDDSSNACADTDDKKELGQTCPFIQIDLGASDKFVSTVTIRVAYTPQDVRKMFFTYPKPVDETCTGAGNANEIGDTASTENTWGNGEEDGDPDRDAGFRVLLTSVERSTDCSSSSGGKCYASSVGDSCPVPAEDTICEHVKAEENLKGLSRFVNGPSDEYYEASIDCRGKKGQYVILELPGSPSGQVTRALAVTEIRVMSYPYASTQSLSYFFEATPSTEMEDITPDETGVTASTEANGQCTASKLLNVTSDGYVETSTFADTGRTLRCPWFQLDLGEGGQYVSKVDITAELRAEAGAANVNSDILRELFFVYDSPPTSNNDLADNEATDSSVAVKPQSSPGLRVYVSNAGRTQLCKDTGAGFCDGDSITTTDKEKECNAITSGTLCETLVYDAGAGVNRFRYHEDTAEDAVGQYGTATIDCRADASDQQSGPIHGRYVIIDLPDASQTQKRKLTLHGVRVFGSGTTTTTTTTATYDLSHLVLGVSVSTNSTAFPTEQIMDSKLNTFGETGDETSATRCPWIQADLGESKVVTKVVVTLPFGPSFQRARRVFFNGTDLNNVTDVTAMSGEVESGGLRVVVTSRGRTAAELGAADGCPTVALEVCETISYDNYGTQGGDGLDRFADDAEGKFFADAKALQNAAAENFQERTLTVLCPGKQGQYVIVELPGTEESHRRVLAVSDLRIFGNTVTQAPVPLAFSLADVETACAQEGATRFTGRSYSLGTGQGQGQFVISGNLNEMECIGLCARNATCAGFVYDTSIVDAGNDNCAVRSLPPNKLQSGDYDLETATTNDQVLYVMTEACRNRALSYFGKDDLHNRAGQVVVQATSVGGASAELLDSNSGTAAATSSGASSSARCAWFQIDLGEPVIVSSLKLTVSSTLEDLRRLLFDTNLDASAAWNASSTPEKDANKNLGLRIALTNTPRNDQTVNDDTYCPTLGSEVCETIKTGETNPTERLSGGRFPKVSPTEAAATVMCGRRIGRYVIIEGASATDDKRAFSINDVKVYGETTTTTTPAPCNLEEYCLAERSPYKVDWASIYDGFGTTYSDSFWYPGYVYETNAADSAAIVSTESLYSANIDNSFEAKESADFAAGSAFTYEAWIYPTNEDAHRKEIFGGTAKGFYLIRAEGTGDEEYNKECKTVSEDYNYQPGPGEASKLDPANPYVLHVGYTSTFSTLCIRFGQWTHVAATVSSNAGNSPYTVVLYLNGEEVQRNTNVVTPVVISTQETMFPAALGQSIGGGFLDSDERIFNVRAWNTVRTEAQIRRYALAVRADQIDTTTGLAWWFPLQKSLNSTVSAETTDTSGIVSSFPNITAVASTLAHTMLATQSCEAADSCSGFLGLPEEPARPSQYITADEAKRKSFRYCVYSDTIPDDCCDAVAQVRDQCYEKTQVVGLCSPVANSNEFPISDCTQ
ncbi:unnamed protein product [Amoebophrya sp. A120]|nr:unnamed protein product [Amoebophrya sp. A120]|eukprot:GSA120T00020621001.1